MVDLKTVCQGSGVSRLKANRWLWWSEEGEEGEEFTFTWTNVLQGRCCVAYNISKHPWGTGETQILFRCLWRDSCLSLVIQWFFSQSSLTLNSVFSWIWLFLIPIRGLCQLGTSLLDLIFILKFTGSQELFDVLIWPIFNPVFLLVSWLSWLSEIRIQHIWSVYGVLKE